MKAFSRNRSGFTIIEVALAATILLVGFGGLVQAMALGTEMLDTARKQTVAAQIAQTEIEHLRTLEWSGILNLASNSPTAIGSYPEFTTPNPNPLQATAPALASIADSSFKLRRQVADVSGSGLSATLRKVTLSVAWTSNTGKSHTRSFDAYFAKNGLYVSYQKS